VSATQCAPSFFPRHFLKLAFSWRRTGFTQNSPAKAHRQTL